MIATSSVSIVNVNDGATGATGPQGVSVTKVVEEYRLSNSNTELTGSGTGYSWSETKPDIPSGKYLWIRERTDLSNNTSSYGTAHCDIVISGLVQDVDRNSNAITSKVWESDITTKINEYDGSTGAAIRNRVSQTETNISGITSRVSDVESETDSLGTRMTSAESSITQNANNIALKVSQDGVISAINQSAESILISASKVDIQGAVSFSSLDSTLQGRITGVESTASTANNTANTANATANTALKGMKVYSGTCSTAASTAAKVVSCSDTDFEMTNGTTITVKFSNASTVASPTLNVNSKGAKAIYLDGAEVSSSNILRWQAGSVITFQYDGAHWVVMAYQNLDYFVCSTAAGTTAKATNSVTGTFVLCKGTTITVFFGTSNSVNAPTLNVGSTGAYAIYYKNAVTSASNQYLWSANTTVNFTFNGSYWYVNDGGAQLAKDYAKTAVDWVGTNGSTVVSAANIMKTWTDDATLATTTIDGGYIKTHTIESTHLATNAIMSQNYTGLDNSHFSSEGSYLDLSTGNFYTPKFGVSAEGQGGAYINGEVVATSGRFGNDTSYWNIATVYDYNSQPHASLVGTGSPYLQTGNWQVSDNAVATRKYTSTSESVGNATYYKDSDTNTFYDVGMKIPTDFSSTAATNDVGRYNKAFYYGRKYTGNNPPTVEGNWVYFYMLDTSGNLKTAGTITTGGDIYEGGTKLSEKYAAISDVGSVYLPKTGGTITGNLTVNGSFTTNLQVQTNLASTSAAQLTGNANATVTHGVTGTLGVGNGGTGQTTAQNAANAFINALSTGSTTSMLRDADYFISQYIGGGTSNTKYYRRPISTIWDYIENKIETTYDITNTYRRLDNNDFDTINVTDLTAGNLIVNGAARFTNDVFADTFTGNLVGTASNAVKVGNNLVIKLNGGSTEGTNLFTYNGSAAKTINITASSIGAQASGTYAGGISNGGAASKLAYYSGNEINFVSTASTPPYQVHFNWRNGYTNTQTGTSSDINYYFENYNGEYNHTTLCAAQFSGNAATATKLATARTITLSGSVTGSTTFDGSGNVTIATTTNHTHNYAGSSSAGGSANTVAGETGSVNAARHVWFSDSSTETKRNYDDDFKYNPSTNVLTVGSITGNAATATKVNKSLKMANNKSFDGSADVNLFTNDLIPAISKTYTSTAYYSTNDSWDNSSWYFMSVKPDSWYKTWRVKFKVRSYCPGYTSVDSTSWVEVYGRANSTTSYKIYNEFYDRGHYYINVYPLTSAGFNAGYGHAIGISIRYATSYTSSSYYRTFEVDYYNSEGCAVTILDTPVKWASWAGTGTTNYGALNAFDACNRGLRETGDDNNYDILQMSTNYINNGDSIRMPGYTLMGLDRSGNGQAISLYTSTYDGTTVSISTSRVYNTAGIDWTKGIYYSTTSTNYAKSAVLQTSLRIAYTALDFRYTDNNVASSTANSLGMVSYKPVYFRGVIKNDGLFYLAPISVTYNNSTYQRAWTQDIPTSVETDGTYQYVYWFLGYPYYNSSYANSQYQLNLFSENKMYWYHNNRFEEYVQESAYSDRANHANVTSTVNAVAYYTDTTGTFGSKASANGALYATSANGALQWGTLPVAQGGTGLTASPSILVNLASTSATNVMAASPRPGVTGTLPIANGGTGATTADGIKTNLSLNNVTNNKQVKGLASGTTSGHLVSWGSDGYTVADSGLTATSVATKITLAGSDYSASSNTITITQANLQSAVQSTGLLLMTSAERSKLASIQVSEGGTIDFSGVTASTPLTATVGTNKTVNITHNTSGVTAGTYRSVTVNTYGHVTAGTNPTTLSGYGITDAKIASGVITLGSNTITPLTASSTLDATKLSGTASISTTGNAATATTASKADKLTTGRTISLTGDVTGSTTFDGSGNVSITATVADNSHYHTVTNITTGDSSVQGSLDPITVTMIGSAASNKTFGLPANAITIQYSTNGGSTWTDYGASDAQKKALFAETRGFGPILGKSSSASTNTVNNQLRVIIEPTDRYVSLHGIYVWMSSNGNTCVMDLERSTIGAKDTFTTVFTNQPISGWSGNNIRYFSSGTFGGGSTQTSNNYKYRITFKQTAVNTSYNSAQIIDIRFIGNNVWSSPNTMVSKNHMYSWDENLNVTFPANITANTFVGALSGNATSATTATTAGEFTSAKSVTLTGDTTGTASSTGGWSLETTTTRLSVVGDKRSEATTPNSYFNKLIFQGLKNKSAIGNPSNDSYSFLIGLRGYGDASGGKAHEFAFNDSGINHRTGSTTTWDSWEKLVTSANYTDYTVTKTGTGAFGTWGISISGNAATATSASSATTASNLSGFTNTTTSATAIDSATQNGHVYVNGTSGIYNQSDGAAFVQAYSTSWVAQIYQDYRTGQIALRGKNNGTWQSWRKVLDSTNYTDYTVTKTGTGASGSWGISVTGNAATSTKWASAQTVYVALGTASKTTSIQGGNSSAVTLGVDGVLGVANGGTGASSFTANSVIMSGSTTTGAFTTRAVTNNTSASAVTANTNLITANTLAYWTGSSNLTTCSQGTFGTMASASASDYLKLSGGTMTGTIITTPNTLSMNFRNYNSYNTGFFYGTTGNEALTVALQNSVTSFMIKHGTDPSSYNSGTWNTGVPTLQAKKNSVYINELIPSGTDPTYKFKVNGTSALKGGTDLFDSTSDNTHANVSYDSTLQAIVFSFA